MRNKQPDTAEQDRRERLGRVEAMLAEAGLSPLRVERCPDPTCPVCARARRAAA